MVGWSGRQDDVTPEGQRWSARKTVLILMIAWGLAAMLCGLVQTKAQFHLARFVLGLLRGGVWPAVLILLASWFPLREQARANALWIACLPISSIIMAPLSGWMLDHASWRRVLVLQGVPPLPWALLWWFAVADRPAQAKWISSVEADHLGPAARRGAVPLVVGIAALLLGQAADGALVPMVLLCVTAVAVCAPYGPFWTIPGEPLRFEAVAVAMGLTNALGNPGGFAGP
ncbi:MFS transporter [Streptomyces sp. 8N706]|uniref:MFS transporter n=1 Tax=Streptomyces sp. 8N706 TaxID=3457416 RepID=UPI003FD0EFD5